MKLASISRDLNVQDRLTFCHIIWGTDFEGCLSIYPVELEYNLACVYIALVKNPETSSNLIRDS